MEGSRMSTYKMLLLPIMHLTRISPFSRDGLPQHRLWIPIRLHLLDWALTQDFTHKSGLEFSLLLQSKNSYASKFEVILHMSGSVALSQLRALEEETRPAMSSP